METPKELESSKADFAKDINRGIIGEKILAKTFNWHIPPANPETKLPERRFDLVYPPHTIEIKTDFYDMEKTPNFFMEKVSDEDFGSLGGPWRAADDNVDWFVYFFIKNARVFCWKTANLVSCLNAVTKNMEPSKVENKNYTTKGFKVKRSTLTKHCLFEKSVPKEIIDQYWSEKN